MDIVTWPGLEARPRGRRVLGLRYEPGDSFMVVELEGGELRVSADDEGWQVYFSKDWMAEGSLFLKWA